MFESTQSQPEATSSLDTAIRGQNRRFAKCKMLLGMRLRSRDDELIGEVEDLVLETHGGAIAFVLFRFIEDEKRFIVPYGAVSFSQDRDSLIVDSSRAVFENTPGIDEF